MADEAQAGAPAAEEPTDTALMDKASAAIKAREEAAPAEGKGASASAATADSSTSSTKSPQSTDAKNADGASKGKSKPARSGDIAALADREYKLTQAEKALKTERDAFAPLAEALGKKDLVGFLNKAAEKYGFTFADFVDAMSQDKPPEKSPAEIARETTEATLRKAREDEAKEREAAATKQVDDTLAARKAEWLAMAEADGDRWELVGMNPVVGRTDDGKPITAIDTAWDIIEGAWLADRKAGKTPTAMPIADVLDLVETKLRERRDGRKKKDTATASAGGNGRKEAASKGNGRAAEPSFTQRNTSGVPGAVGDRDDVDISDLPDHEAIKVAARRARLSL